MFAIGEKLADILKEQFKLAPGGLISVMKILKYYHNQFGIRYPFSASNCLETVMNPKIIYRSSLTSLL